MFASAWRILQEAEKALNSLQSNAETIRKSLNLGNEAMKRDIPQMIRYLHRIGLTMEDIDRLSVIHVAGTKGKGSTCAFAESILLQHGYRTGLFSSPHLIEARERIRINGRPVDRELFSSAFWEVYNKLQATKASSDGEMPHYFSFLTVMALFIFVRNPVDAVLLEVGIGGQYDSTNLVASPVVCGIASLDLDHTNLLGHTLTDIAWHKAGIFKKGVPGITVPQPDSAMETILQRAHEIQSPLSIAAPLRESDLSSSTQPLSLGIAGHKQVYNAALAVQLCQVWLDARQSGEAGRDVQRAGEGDITPGVAPGTVQDIPVRHCTALSKRIITGLVECRWPGRTQTVRGVGVTYYLDGAHTTDSMQHCVEWFRRSADQERKELQGAARRALVFNMTGDRPVSSLLKALKECDFHGAAFCPNVVSTIASETTPDQLNLTVEQDTVIKKSITNRQAWDQLFTDQPTPPLWTASTTHQPTTDHRVNTDQHSDTACQTNTGQSPENVSPKSYNNNTQNGGSIINATETQDNVFSSSNDNNNNNPQSQAVDSSANETHNALSSVDATETQKEGSVNSACIATATPVDTSSANNNNARSSVDAAETQKERSANFRCIATALCWARETADVVPAKPSLPAAAAISSNQPQDTGRPRHVQILVTGSLHLVGGVLKLIAPHMND